MNSNWQFSYNLQHTVNATGKIKLRCTTVQRGGYACSNILQKYYIQHLRTTSVIFIPIKCNCLNYYDKLPYPMACWLWSTIKKYTYHLIPIFFTWSTLSSVRRPWLGFWKKEENACFSKYCVVWPKSSWNNTFCQ